RVSSAYSATSGLVFVRRADAAQRGPNFFVSEPLFARVVERAVIGKYQVRARTDLHTLGRNFDPLLDEAIGFDEESLRIDDHAVAQHAGLTAMDDARRQQVQHKRLVADLDRMPGVVPALITRDDVEPLREQIDDLAFTFIAPLGADDCDYVSHKSPRSQINNFLIQLDVLFRRSFPGIVYQHSIALYLLPVVRTAIKVKGFAYFFKQRTGIVRSKLEAVALAGGRIEVLDRIV